MSDDPRPTDFICDTCAVSHQVPHISATTAPGVDFVAAVEAAAEVEHFAATGCRGRIKLAVLALSRSETTAALAAGEQWRQRWLKEQFHADSEGGRTSAMAGERDAALEERDAARVELANLRRLGKEQVDALSERRNELMAIRDRLSEALGASLDLLQEWYDHDGRGDNWDRGPKGTDASRSSKTLAFIYNTRKAVLIAAPAPSPAGTCTCPFPRTQCPECDHGCETCSEACTTDLKHCGGCGDPCGIWREDRPLYANDPCAWIREPGLWVFDCKNQDPREAAPAPETGRTS